MVLRVNGYFYLLNNVRYINIHGKLTEIVNLLEKWTSLQVPRNGALTV